MDEHLLGIFRAEAESLLSRMATEALALEDPGEHGQHIDQLFRDAHTIKGSAGLVGLPEAGAVAHVLEDVLGELRSGRRDVSPAVVDVVLRGIDDLRAVVAGLLAGEDVTALVAAAIPRLRGAPAGDAPSGGRGPAEPPDEPAASPSAAQASPEGPPPAADGERWLVGPEGAAAEPPPAAAAEPPAPPAADPPAPDRRGARAGEGGEGAAAPPAHPLRRAGDDGQVRVPRERLDRLVRLAGEAIADGLRLRARLDEDDPEAMADATRLERTLRTLQQQTLAARMTTVAIIAEPLRRAVRDVARDEGRLVRFELDADAAELDRAVLDALRDPLLHLVRNAVGHGIEPPEERRAAGKDETGVLAVRSWRAGTEVVVEVADDGRGLDLARLRERAGEPGFDDADAARLVFRPGLSTTDSITGLAGRGVGMDAVATAVRGLRGRVEVRTTAGQGTVFTLRVPVSLAVLPCLLVAAGGQRYALPAHSATKVLEAGETARVGLEGGSAMWSGGELVPLAGLAEVLGCRGDDADGPAIVLTGAAGRRQALRVGALLGQRTVTVSDLGDVLPPVPVVAGASIEADGSVVLVLDPAAVVARAAGRREAPVPADAGAVPERAVRVLVVDDAMTVRELQRSILERNGFEVEVAGDGQAALDRLDVERPDLVITDLEMPRLDGLGLVRALRARPGLQGLPVLVVSSRAEAEDRRRALQAGADAYIVKRDFDEDALLSAIRDLLGGTTT